MYGLVHEWKLHAQVFSEKANRKTTENPPKRGRCVILCPRGSCTGGALGKNQPKNGQKGGAAHRADARGLSGRVFGGENGKKVHCVLYARRVDRPGGSFSEKADRKAIKNSPKKMRCVLYARAEAFQKNRPKKRRKPAERAHCAPCRGTGGLSGRVFFGKNGQKKTRCVPHARVEAA